MKTAIRDNDPVMFLENTLLYGVPGEVPEGDITLPFGRAAIAREGKDLTIVSYGRCVVHSLAAAEKMKAEKGLDIEVVDLRTIRPLDVATVLKSVAKTHRVLIVEEQRPFCSVGTMLAATIQEEAFDELDAPILRVGTIDAPAIYAPPVEKQFQLPNPERVIAGILKVMR
jgi:pyruvate dehydrogenase E1 component beta subunit